MAIKPKVDMITREDFIKLEILLKLLETQGHMSRSVVKDNCIGYYKEIFVSDEMETQE
ncbi:MAG: hypothetical protein AB7U45_03720 [Desulfamplus sp.]